MKSNGQLGISCVHKTIWFLVECGGGGGCCFCYCCCCFYTLNHVVWLVTTSNLNITFPQFSQLPCWQDSMCILHRYTFYVIRLFLRSILLRFKFFFRVLFSLLWICTTHIQKQSTCAAISFFSFFYEAIFFFTRTSNISSATHIFAFVYMKIVCIDQKKWQ